MLNAFRHHGIGHYAAVFVNCRIFRCSTPSGIMESVTNFATLTRNLEESAQRLPASWNRSRPGVWPVAQRHNVLNAFRHHGIGHIEKHVLRLRA